MIGAAILAVIGLLLIFLEFYLPGMILGILGSVFLFLSVILAAMQAASPLAVFGFFCAVVAALIAVIALAISRIRRTGSKNTLYLNSDQAGYVASEYDAAVIGKQGVATTDLKPSGHAHIAGKDFQVVSQSGYVTQGTPIVVIGGQGAVLIVKPSKQETVV